MILAANQPYFLPYIAYWQLINASDQFYIGDNYAYIKSGWINRNRILSNGVPEYYGIEVQKASSFRLCTELHVAEINKRKKMNKLYEAYHKAPYYEIGAQLVEEILDCSETVLSEFLIFSIRTICRYLEIDTPIHKMSDLIGNDAFKREERIYDMCHRLDATTYINPIGGKALYDVEDFKKHGIRLQFLQTRVNPYKQFDNEFVENLSILDVIMFNSKDTIREMLGKYTLE